MKRHTNIRFVALALLGISTTLLVADSTVHARGFGGGVRGGGGGGGRVGGGGYGGGSQRFSSPAVGQFGGGGGASGFRTTSPVVGPGGGVRQGGAGGGSYTTKGGTSINYGGAGFKGTTPGGIDYGRGVGGVNVTTPGGRDFTKVGTAGGAIGPGGAAIGGKSSIGVGTGPGGSFATGSKSAGAIGPGGVAIGGKSTVGIGAGPGGVYGGATRSAGVIGPGGAAGYHGGVAVGPYGAVGGKSAFAAGPYGAVAGRTTVAAGRYGTYHVSSTAFASQCGYVRRGFNHYNAFSPGWYGRYPGSWYAAGWAAGRAWTLASWGNLYPYCGYAATPIYYNYGDTVIYYSDNVYQNGDQVATAADYAQQATQIADAGRQANPPPTDDWKPLGVFALVQDEETTSYKIFQLALNKDGVIRGNYYDALSDATTPVYGSVDKQTQRAAWSIGEKKTIVFEAGIANLTEDQTTVLVHFSPDNTQQFSLVRVEKKDDSP